MTSSGELAHQVYLMGLRDEDALCDECEQRRGFNQCDVCGDQFCDGCIDHHSEEAHRRHYDDADE
jgi:hypothetical protein